MERVETMSRATGSRPITRVIIFSVVWIFTAYAAEPGPPRASEGCGARSHLTPGESVSRSIRVGELEREYRLHLPSGYDATIATPLLLVLHGYTGNVMTPDNDYTDFSAHADQHGYIVAYPQATGFEFEGRLITSWNDLGCNASPGPQGPICTENADDYPTPPECGKPRQCDWCSCHDDVGFIAALLDELEATLCVDLDRVFATGMSNGAMFTHRLACDLSDRLAAVAPISGTIARGFGCAPPSTAKISMISFHGTRDEVVRFDGSPSVDGFMYTPTARVVDAWAATDSQGCDDENSPYPTSKDDVAGLECVQRANCSSGAEVVACALNVGHDWPRKGEDRYAIDLMWEFFTKNGR